MLASLIINDWVSVDLSKSSTFEGGLLEYSELEDDNYEDSKDDYCDIYDLLKETYGPDDLEYILVDRADSLCKMFKGLDKAGKIFIGIESGAGFSIILWIFMMILYWAKGTGLSLAYLFAAISLICHVVAIAVFLALTNTKFGSCDDFPTNGDLPELCAEVGPSIAIAVLAGLGFCTLLFFIVACRMQRSCGHSGLAKEAESHNTSVRPEVKKNRENFDNTKIHDVKGPETHHNDYPFKKSTK
jgi:hypothetical protein